MLKWCIFYADGSTFSSDDGPPYDAPGVGVQIIVQEHETKRDRPYFVHMCDYYTWRGDRWIGVDASGLDDYLFSMKPNYSRMALKGRTIKNEDWAELRKLAVALRDRWHDNRNVRSS